MSSGFVGKVVFDYAIIERENTTWADVLWKISCEMS